MCQLAQDRIHCKSSACICHAQSKYQNANLTVETERADWPFGVGVALGLPILLLTAVRFWQYGGPVHAAAGNNLIIAAFATGGSAECERVHRKHLPRRDGRGAQGLPGAVRHSAGDAGVPQELLRLCAVPAPQRRCHGHCRCVLAAPSRDADSPPPFFSRLPPQIRPIYPSH